MPQQCTIISVVSSSITSISIPEIYVGESPTITVTIDNPYESSLTVTLKIYREDTLITTHAVSLSPLTQTTVTINDLPSESTPGTYNYCVKIDDEEPVCETLTVSEQKGPYISDISAPPVPVGTSPLITLTINNPSGEPATLTIKTYRNNVFITSQNISFSSGETTKQITLSDLPPESTPGTYNYCFVLNDQQPVCTELTVIDVSHVTTEVAPILMYAGAFLLLAGLVYMIGEAR